MVKIRSLAPIIGRVLAVSKTYFSGSKICFSALNSAARFLRAHPKQPFRLLTTLKSEKKTGKKWIFIKDPSMTKHKKVAAQLTGNGTCICIPNAVILRSLEVTLLFLHLSKNDHAGIHGHDEQHGRWRIRILISSTVKRKEKEQSVDDDCSFFMS